MKKHVTWILIVTSFLLANCGNKMSNPQTDEKDGEGQFSANDSNQPPRIILSKSSTYATNDTQFNYDTDSIYAKFENVEAGAIACAEAVIPERGQNDTHCQGNSNWAQFPTSNLATNRDWAPYDYQNRRFVFGAMNPATRVLKNHPIFPNMNATYRFYVKNRPQDAAVSMTFTVTKGTPPVQPTDAVNIDPFNQQSVKNAYLNIYRVNSAKDMNWTGSVQGCDPGHPGAGYREAVVNVVNYYRALTGINGDVKLNEGSSVYAQAAALMMKANGQLSHHPPTSWTCYSQNGAAGAGSSNIALGANGPSAIDLYMDDWGSNNYAVGHRRWILWPSLGNVGVGAVPGADALGVLGGGGGVRRDPPNGVSWPSQGYFPVQHMPGSRRWSFSKAGASVSQANIQVRRNGTLLTSTKEQFYPGYGDETVVWVQDGVDGSLSTYQVTISNVMENGVAKTYNYNIQVFNPEQ